MADNPVSIAGIIPATSGLTGVLGDAVKGAGAIAGTAGSNRAVLTGAGKGAGVIAAAAGLAADSEISYGIDEPQWTFALAAPAAGVIAAPVTTFAISAPAGASV
jgi:hypothetical protein